MLVTILNIAGLSVNFAGVYMMFRANPKVGSSNFYLLDNDDEFKEVIDAPKKNRLYRWGMFVLVFGFLIQLSAILLSFSAVKV